MDKPHTKSLWNFGYRVGHAICDLFDDWLEYKVHIPDKFFRLQDSELQAIDYEERSIFTRAATRLMKMAGAKTAEEAHGMIDGLSVASSFLTLGWVIINHYRVAFKESPKMARRRAEAKARKEALLAAGGNRSAMPAGTIPLVVTGGLAGATA